MNRAERRKNARETKKKRKHNTVAAASVVDIAAHESSIRVNGHDAQGFVDGLPVPAIVGGINNLLAQLEKRKVPICDWDDQGRQLYRLQIKRGKVYFLAADQDPED